MDEKELTLSENQDTQEFSLEDIMKEFSPEQPQEEEEEQPIPQDQWYVN